MDTNEVSGADVHIVYILQIINEQKNVNNQMAESLNDLKNSLQELELQTASGDQGTDHLLLRIE